ncbi:hypothetical protein [Paraburkholderia sp. BL6665CI2N2]|uniref:hypothetical protein n=1 Tax=Paraburkholderia sp. BL6665CI2N2 TaxID=1938806 RepID=UPI001416FBD9|nr:hypothetical protein [Paraburkholderia sp. BL6665CI2N2]
MREPLGYRQLPLTGKQRQYQQSGSVDFGILRLMPPNRSPATTSGDITPEVDLIVNVDVVILFSADAESVLARKKAQLRRAEDGKSHRAQRQIHRPGRPSAV